MKMKWSANKRWTIFVIVWYGEQTGLPVGLDFDHQLKQNEGKCDWLLYVLGWTGLEVGSKPVNVLLFKFACTVVYMWLYQGNLTLNPTVISKSILIVLSWVKEFQYFYCLQSCQLWKLDERISGFFLLLFSCLFLLLKNQKQKTWNGDPCRIKDLYYASRGE